MSALRCLALFVALLAAAVQPARGDDARLNRLLEVYDALALWHDGRIPVLVRKWTQPLKVRMTGPMSRAYADYALEALKRTSALTGLAFETIGPEASGENLLIEFEDTGSYIVDGRSAGCVAYTSTRSNGEIRRVNLKISIRSGATAQRCIGHELLHGLGFPGHPHEHDSVLSYVHRRERMTELDEIALSVHYHESIRPGMFALPALLAARTVLAARLGLPTAPDDVAKLGRPISIAPSPICASPARTAIPWPGRNSATPIPSAITSPRTRARRRAGGAWPPRTAIPTRNGGWASP